MYQPYPTPGPEPAAEPVQPPRSVRTAARLMYLAAGAEVVALIVALLTRGSLRAAILSRHPHYTAAQLHTAETARTVTLIVGALIAVGLWLWMARANGRGRGWARVVAAVLFGINTLDLIVSFAAVRDVADLIGGVVIWLIGLAAIVLLFSRESAPFYARPAAA
ncbi:MAG TPA: hypothetical protein VMH35_17215 [Streptosporangiaceae bacterium]|nr:hypothetical protein [Streptosporangiaceae bacterium]